MFDKIVNFGGRVVMKILAVFWGFVMTDSNQKKWEVICYDGDNNEKEKVFFVEATGYMEAKTEAEKLYGSNCEVVPAGFVEDLSKEAGTNYFGQPYW